MTSPQDLNALSKSVTAVDLSKSEFRGSGALYQSDRLTLGRTAGKFFIEGKERVIEKTTYVQDESAMRVAEETSDRLKESLIRLLVVSAERERMARQISQLQNTQIGVFQNQQNFEVQQLRTDNMRLSQLLQDKDREIQYVKEAETRKSALQSGDLATRLTITGQENKRLQTANLERIDQINTLQAEVARVRQEYATKITDISTDPRIVELKHQFTLKDHENTTLKERLSVLENTQQEIVSLRVQLQDTNRKAADEMAAMKIAIESDMNRQLYAMEQSYRSLADQEKANSQARVVQIKQYLKTEMTQIERKNQDLAAQNSSILVQLHVLQSEAIKSSEMSQEKSQRLIGFESLTKSLQEEVQNLQFTTKQLSSDLTSKHEATLNLSKDLEQANSRLHELKTECQTQKNDNKEISQEYIRVKSEYQKLASLSSEAAQKIKGLTEQVEQLRIQKGSLLSKHESELDHTKESMAQQETKMREEIEELKSQIHSERIRFENMSIENKNELTELLQQITAFKKDIDQERAASSANQKRFEREKNEAIEALNDQRIQLSAIKHEKAELQERLDREHKSMEAQIAELKSDNSHLSLYIKTSADDFKKKIAEVIEHTKLLEKKAASELVQAAAENERRIAEEHLKKAVLQSETIQKEIETAKTFAENKLQESIRISEERAEIFKQQLKKSSAESEQALKIVQEKLGAQISDLQTGNISLKESLTKLNKTLQDTEHDADLLRERTASLKTETESLKQELTKIPALEEEKAFLQQSNKVLVANVSNLKETVATARSSLQLAEANIIKLQEVEMEQQSQIDSLQEEVQVRQQEYVDIQGELERVNRLLDSADKSLKEKDRQIVELTKQSASRHEETIRVLSKLEDSERELNKLSRKTGGDFGAINVENQQLRSQLNSAQQELYNLRQRETGDSDSIRKQLMNAEQDLYQARRMSAQLQMERDNAVLNLDRANSRIDELERDREISKTKLSDSQMTVIHSRSSHVEKESLAVQKTQLESTIVVLNNQLKFDREELDKMRRKLSKADDMISRSVEDYRHLQLQCEQYKREAMKFKDTAEELVDDCIASEELAEKYRKAANELKHTRSDLDVLKKAHDKLKKEMAKRIEHNTKLADAFEKQRLEFQKAFDSQTAVVSELETTKEELYNVKQDLLTHEHHTNVPINLASTFGMKGK